MTKNPVFISLSKITPYLLTIESTPIMC